MNLVEVAAIDQRFVGDAILAIEEERPEFFLVTPGKGRKNALYQVWRRLGGRADDDPFLEWANEAVAPFLVELGGFQRFLGKIKGQLIAAGLFGASHICDYSRCRE